MSGVIINPKVTQNIIPAEQRAGFNEQKVLFIGQKTASGTATSGALEENVLLRSDIETRFGARSLLAQMMRAARIENDITQFDAIALDDNGAGVAATATLAFTGAATADGTFTIQLASGKNGTYSVDVLSGDTAAVVATALHNVLTADTIAPFTSSDNTTGTLTLTAENKGTTANGFLLRVTSTVPGITMTPTPWASGATDPVLTGLFDVIGNKRYQTIVWPGAYDITVLTDFTKARFNVTNDVLDGIGIVTKTDTLSNLKAFALAENTQTLVVMGNKAATGYTGTHILEADDVMTAMIGALRSLRLTDGANLSGVVTTTSSSDQFGGVSRATLPYFNTPLRNILVSPTGTMWSDLEIKELGEEGVSVAGPNRANNSMILDTLYTTRVNDDAGNPDATFHFLNTVDSSSVAREYFVNNYRLKYVQSRLTDGDLIDGISMENAQSIRSFTLELYDDLADLAITQLGEQAKKAYAATLTVTTDLVTGTATINHAPPLVSQLREIVGTIRVNFQI